MSTYSQTLYKVNKNKRSKVQFQGQTAWLVRSSCRHVCNIPTYIDFSVHKTCECLMKLCDLFEHRTLSTVGLFESVWCANMFFTWLFQSKKLFTVECEYIDTVWVESSSILYGKQNWKQMPKYGSMYQIDEVVSSVVGLLRSTYFNTLQNTQRFFSI